MNWCRSNSLIINAQKTQMLFFSPKLTRADFNSLPSIFLDGQQLTYANRAKNLGLKINNTLTWSDHISDVSSKIFSGLRKLWIHSHLMPTATRLKLFKSLILPIFTYCDVVLADLTQSNYKVLERALNACTRFVYRLRKYDSLGVHRNSLLGCSLKTFLKYRCCMYIKKTVQQKSPDYILENLHFSQSLRTGNLILPPHSNHRMHSSFFVFGPKCWNSLPLHIKNLNSMTNFKKSSFTFLANL